MYLRGQIAQRANPGRPTAPLWRRESGNDGEFKLHPLVIVSAVVVVVIFLGIGITFLKRRHNRKKTADPAPTSSWGRLTNAIRGGGGHYEQTSRDDNAESHSQSHQLDTTTSGNSRTGSATTPAQQQTNASAAADSTVNRHTSVRSIMTLPAYSMDAANNEQVLGREGERDGVDTIVDLPTAESEEALREAEMNSLFLIREARRQQQADRADRSRRRVEAESRRDAAALREIRAETRAANNSNLIESLRRDIDDARGNRNRSVSSVSYGDLGVARHDGTRLRASSNDSERMGLLSDAASIGGASARSGARSPGLHRRDPSTTSLASVESGAPSPTLNRSRTPSQSFVQSDARAGSSPELVDADLGDEAMPPPDYEEVSLDNDSDFRRSMTSLHQEPPPGYTGPYRSASQRSTGASAAGTEAAQGHSSVPEIVIEPSEDQVRRRD